MGRNGWKGVSFRRRRNFFVDNLNKVLFPVFNSTVLSQENGETGETKVQFFKIVIITLLINSLSILLLVVIQKSYNL